MNNPKKSLQAVERFISGLKVVPVISCVDKYAEVKVALRKNGTPMHDEFDLIIGVMALENKLTLVTDNVKDFRFIAGLQIENWMIRD